MDDTQSHLFDNFQFNAPITEEALMAFEQKLGRQLPDEYVRILANANGLEGELVQGKTSVRLWALEDVAQNNADVEAPRLIPGILLIGETNEGEAIALDLRDTSETYGYFYMLPFQPLDWDESERLGGTIEDALEKLKNPFNLQEGENAKPLSEE